MIENYLYGGVWCLRKVTLKAYQLRNLKYISSEAEANRNCWWDDKNKGNYWSLVGLGLEPNKILSSKYPVLATKSEKTEDNGSERKVVRGLKQGDNQDKPFLEYAIIS